MRGVLTVLSLALKRATHNARLMLATFAGLLIAVSVVSAAPMYTDGTLSRLLRASLAHDAQTYRRPPIIVWLQSTVDLAQGSPLEQFARLDAFYSSNAQASIGVPLRKVVHFASTAAGNLTRSDQLDLAETERRFVGLAYMEGLADHVKIVDGANLPPDGAADGDIPVIVFADVAAQLNLSVGERYRYTKADRYNPRSVWIRIVGLWESVDLGGDSWPYDPYALDVLLFTDRRDLFDRIIGPMPDTAYEFSWYGAVDDTRIQTSDARSIADGLKSFQSRAKGFMPTVKVVGSSTDTLADFVSRANLLNAVLVALSLPMLAVILSFIASSVGMVVERQRGEIALFKSRGASTRQIAGIYLAEATAMAVIALGLGLLAGTLLARLIGSAYGFLLFARRPALDIAISAEPIRYATAAAALSILATALPAATAATQTIVSHKQDVARSSRRPLWQRRYLDVVLLLVAGYGYNLLRQQQTIISAPKGQDLVVDPLLLVVPAVFVFGLALVFLRLFPLLTAALARGAAHIGSSSILLALRQVARAPQQYAALVLLLSVTVALGAYSASAAHTIDRSLAERTLYDLPADLEITEGYRDGQAPGAGGGPDGGRTYEEPPAQSYFVDGVLGASRFHRFKATPTLAGAKDLQLLAIDRTTYPALTWWRRDFARESLGALMNVLGAGEAAAIVDRGFLSDYHLIPGDRFALTIDGQALEFYVADTADYFPTLHPESGHFVVANLDYVYDHVGIQPSQVWLELQPSARSGDVVDAIHREGVKVVDSRDSRVALVQGRTDPQRTGLFGMLTIGFAVATLLTVIAFFLYAFLSFERRLLQMGILRAIGLSVRQLFGLLIFEQAYLIALGVAFGTGLGILTGNLFIPFPQVSADAQGKTPPFVIETAWVDIGRIYVVLALMLVAGLISTIWLISRMKLYQTVKLGEEQ